MLREPGDRHVRGRRPQRDPQAAAGDGGRQAVRGPGDHHQQGIGGRLLERLQKGVGGVHVERLGPFDDPDLVAAAVALGGE